MEGFTTIFRDEKSPMSHVWCACMNQKDRGCRAIYPEWDPEDRFTALEEVKTLLKSRFVEIGCVLDILFKSNDGCIEFNIGDVAIQFVRGFGVWSERKDVIQMTVELQKGDFGDIVGYEYTLDDLRLYASKLAELGI